MLLLKTTTRLRDLLGRGLFFYWHFSTDWKVTLSLASTKDFMLPVACSRTERKGGFITRNRSFHKSVVITADTTQQAGCNTSQYNKESWEILFSLELLVDAHSTGKEAKFLNSYIIRCIKAFRNHKRQINIQDAAICYAHWKQLSWNACMGVCWHQPGVGKLLKCAGWVWGMMQLK